MISDEEDKTTSSNVEGHLNSYKTFDEYYENEKETYRFMNWTLVALTAASSSMIIFAKEPSKKIAAGILTAFPLMALSYTGSNKLSALGNGKCAIDHGPRLDFELRN